MTVLLRICLSLLVCFIATAPANSDDSPVILRSMEARYGAARTLQVNFLERYLQNGKFVRAEAGTAYFLRPGKMRWDYESPEKNIFVVDGTYTWFYSPADRTATRVPTKQSDDWRTPLAFLTSHIKLSKLCSKIEAEKESQAADASDSVFRCELREPEDNQATAPAHESVLFEVSSEGELRRIVVHQEGGIEMEFSFTGWKWNPPLDKSLFQFSPPRGVAIVNGLLPDAPGVRQ
jgi:outer membrane lipoprotein carrier protein